jgi:hypothetical protein
MAFPINIQEINKEKLEVLVVSGFFAIFAVALRAMPE